MQCNVACFNEGNPNGCSSFIYYMYHNMCVLYINMVNKWHIAGYVYAHIIGYAEGQTMF